MMQLELLQDEPKQSVITISDIIHGNCCRIKSNNKVVMRIKLTGFMLNSNIVTDVLNRGDVFIIDMAKGTMYVVHGDIEVTPLTAKLQYKVKELK